VVVHFVYIGEIVEHSFHITSHRWCNGYRARLDCSRSSRSTALEVSTLAITPPMNSRSTVLEASTLTITPPMNSRSTNKFCSSKLSLEI
jgi:hypothetical protein